MKRPLFVSEAKQGNLSLDFALQALERVESSSKTGMGNDKRFNCYSES